MQRATQTVVKSLTSYCRLKCRKELQRSFSTATRVLGRWEPDGLNTPPEIPEYGEVLFRFRGYDYPVLESFATYVHRLANNLELDIEVRAVPSQDSEVKIYKPNTSVVEHQYTLNKYERQVQLSDVPSTILPVFLDAIRQQTPEGVEVTVKEPTAEDEDYLYIPDSSLMDKQAQLEDLGGGAVKRK